MSAATPLPSIAPESRRIADLTTKLLQTAKELMAAQTELRNVRVERDQLRTRAAADRAQIAALEPELEAARAQIAALESELAAARGQIAELERGSARDPGVQSLASPPRPPDDLTRIRGIGPAFARALASHGVRELAQIAAWTEADVERMASLLKIRAERIRRNDWVGGARALLGAAHGGTANQGCTDPAEE